MKLETSKILGGIGSLLMLIGAVPYINSYGVLEIVGLILVMIALYDLSKYYSEGGIFNNALYGIIVGIVGAVISAGVVFIVVLSSLNDFLYAIFPNWNGDWAALSGLTPDPSSIDIANIAPLLAGLFTILLVLWIISILVAFFFRRSFGTLSQKSGIGLFSTTGLLLLIGAFLIIIFGVGLILIWISALLLAIAFFQLKPPQEESTTSTSTST
jgi:uncharacterized membrane protein